MGDANVLSSAPGMRGLPDLQEYARPKDRPLPIVTRLYNDSADYCHLVCGYFGCDARPFNPLLEALLACSSAKCLQRHKAGYPTCFASPLKRPDAATPEVKVCSRGLPN